jgi:hypothetical protein
VYVIRRHYHPALYQGFGKTRRYFEGWYFKFAFPERVFALIPGISLAQDDPHAFIQVIEQGAEKGAESGGYHRYPVDAFAASRRGFRIQIDDNFFSHDTVRVSLPEMHFEGSMPGRIAWPSTLLSPGAMGWYSFVPGMECRHGVITLDAEASGTADGHPLSPGRFYMEKDYGRSFPHAWIWLQTNSFPEPETCVTASIATVPFMTGAFTGFIVGVLCDGELYRFATYTGAKLRSVTVDASRVEFTLVQKDLSLLVEATRNDGVDLRAPVEGAMQGRVNETLSATVHVTLKAGNRTVFSGRGENAGLEVVKPDSLKLKL